jgi:SAM-dependent methyltransferase
VQTTLGRQQVASAAAIEGPARSSSKEAVLGYVTNRVFHVLRRVRAYYRHGARGEFGISLPRRRVRKILRKHNLGFYDDGTPTWWYSALDLKRNEEDELTKSALRYVEAKAARDASILVTGCGTGWMLFWLSERGFKHVEGFDYLDNVVQSAREIAAFSNIPVKLWQADGFDPRLERDYDLMLVLHWLYSAWMGNYGNTARSEQDRETLLADFLGKYAYRIRPGGVMLLELIDSISDDLQPPSSVYPIRHSSEQVIRCAAAWDLAVEKRMFNFKYGHLPRMLYVLRKTARPGD